MKKSYLLILVLILAMPMSVFAEDRVNLINDQTDILQTTGNAEFEDGVLTMVNTGTYLANFKVPGLTDNYVWSGDIKILDIVDRGPNGVRFCVGTDTDTGDYLNLIVTKSIGIAAERKGPSPLSDVYKLTKEHYSEVIDNGSEFHFEITRNGSHIILKIGDIVAMDYVFPDEFSFFTTGDDYNLGFYSENCSYEVKNLAVYCEDVQITPEPTASPEPTPSPVPTETPEATQSNATATNSPAATDKTAADDDTGVNPLVIGIIAATGVIVIITGVVIIIRKKRS